jgi:hypothetical protein
VLETTSEDVDVTDDTAPSEPVVTMTVEKTLVEDATSADVIVVNEVFSLVDNDDDDDDNDSSLLWLPEDPAADVGVPLVIVAADVVAEVMVVGVLSDVVIDVLVLVVSLVIVVSELESEVEDAAAEDVTPVPNCRLWNMPSRIGESMMGLAAAVADAIMAVTNSGNV